MEKKWLLNWDLGVWLNAKGFILIDALICIVICSVCVMLICQLSLVKGQYSGIYDETRKILAQDSLTNVEQLEPWIQEEVQPTSTP